MQPYLKLPNTPEHNNDDAVVYPTFHQRAVVVTKGVLAVALLVLLATVLAHSLSRVSSDTDTKSPPVEQPQHPQPDDEPHAKKQHGLPAGSGADNLVSFVDVTQSAGISYTLADKTSPPSVGDLNQDGYMDIVQSNHVKVPTEVYFGSSNGTFTKFHLFDEQKMDRHGTAIADYDGDGLPDVILSVGWFFKDRPKFPPMIAKSEHMSAHGLRAVDTNKIGLKPTRQQGNCSRAGVRLVDLDNDGDLDMFLMGRPLVSGANNNAIFENKGSGNFRYLPNTGIEHGKNQGFLVLDYDSDGYQDIVVFNSGVQIFRNNAKNGGTAPISFTDVSTDVLPSEFKGHPFSGSAVIDFDNDGDLDVYLAGGSRQKGPRDVADDVLLENVGGRFIDSSRKAKLPRGGAHIGITVCDFDNNGFVDVFIPRAGSLNQPRLSDLILLNNGDQTFTARDDHGANGPLNGTDASFGVGAQAFDYDNDGLVDVVVASRKHPFDGKLRLFRNMSPTKDYNFLIVRVPVLVNNRPSLDAILRLTLPDGRCLIRKVGSVGESRTQSFINDVHFGLGKTSSVASVSLALSDGSTVTLADPPINTRVALT